MDPTDLMFQAEWLQAVAERLLMRSWSMTIRLHMVEWLRKCGRNRVARFELIGAPSTCPSTVIVKASVGDEVRRFDANVDELRSPAWRFYNEWSATKFLSRLGVDPPFCARPFSGDRAQGIIVFEDLGDGAGLAALMKSSERDSLEAGLLSYAQSMGRIQASTIGRRADLHGIREALGGRESAEERTGAKWLEDNVARVIEQIKRLGVGTAVGYADECGEIAGILDEPGGFLAFSAADMCPNNHVFAPDGSVRIFDFEFAGYHHALLDAAYLLVPWPTCGAAARMPEPVMASLLAAYRAEVAEALPATTDEAEFWRNMVACCAYWSFRTVSWTLAAAIDQDSSWGMATARQRHIQRLSQFASMSVAHRAFPALAETAWNLATRLRTLWPKTPDMPLFPAFR